MAEQEENPKILSEGGVRKDSDFSKDLMEQIKEIMTERDYPLSVQVTVIYGVKLSGRADAAEEALEILKTAKSPKKVTRMMQPMLIENRNRG